MSEVKTNRLGKVAKEFNVSIYTVIEFLKKKGFNIEESPNARIEPEMYKLVASEFMVDKNIKKEANNIDLNYHTNQKQEIEKNAPINKFDSENEPVNDYIIKNTTLGRDSLSNQNLDDQQSNNNHQPSNFTDNPDINLNHLDNSGNTFSDNTSDTSINNNLDPSYIIGPKIIDKIDLNKYNIKKQHPSNKPSGTKKEENTSTTEKQNVDTNVNNKTNIKFSAEGQNNDIQTKEQKNIDLPQTKEQQSIEQRPKEIQNVEKPIATEKHFTQKSPLQEQITSAPQPNGQNNKTSANETSAKIQMKSIQSNIEQEAKAQQITQQIVNTQINPPKQPNNQVAKEQTNKGQQIKEQPSKEQQFKGQPNKEQFQKGNIAKQENFKNANGKNNDGKSNDNKNQSQKFQQQAKPQIKQDNPLAKNTNNNIAADNFLDIKADKLAGPKIISKIELPIEKPKDNKANISSDDSSQKKKKRKRIIKKDYLDKAPVKKDESSLTKEDSTLKKDKDTIGNKKHHNQKKKKDIKKVEISEEEVKKQVHETLNNLEQKGKSKSVKRRREKREAKSEELRRKTAESEAEKSILKVTEFVTVNELATLMNVPVTDVIKTCMNLGVIVSINQRLDAETLSVVADEFGFKVEFVGVEIHEPEDHYEDKEEDRVPRNPIVTVMGHVDHGKTSLLDYIRKTNVIAGEAGGITQHIGAYEVHLPNGRNITFLDTPGHEAFTAMRARGAQITDVVIIVVAADDQVMPQTVEAINHAQAAGVPIIFAINKIDKPTADPDKIRRELSNMNILVEEWGGKYQCQEISAKKGINVDQLLEKVLLEADILDLKGNPNKRAEGTVIESALDKGRGYVAKILVQDGTLHTGDIVLAGTCYGKVKALFNERNQKVESCGPSSPILLLGLNGAPQAGDKFLVLKDEHEAKNIANKRSQLQREMGIRTQKHITLEEIGRRIAIGDFKELNIIVKGDVDGSIEALSDSLLKLSTPEVQVNIIHKSVGQIAETDVMLASASDAIIIGFQVRPSMSARKLAEQEQIDIRTYSVIYKAIDEIKDAIEGMLSPEIEEKITCNVEIREVFKISKVGTVAGGYVQNGTITRNTNIRIIRDGIVIHTGKLGSLKRFKDDTKEVKAGLECGLNVDNFNDIQVGDIIEGFEEIQHQRKL